VAVNVTLLAADASAALHVVAKEPATVAVAVAVLVAIGCAAASAPVTANAGFLAGASEETSGNKNKTNTENALHGRTAAFLSPSPVMS
jgi:hypothetical protein